MKKILTILFLNFLLSILNAQNYKCIKTDAISHFQNSDGTIASVRIDSIYQNAGITDYISYHMIRPLIDTSKYILQGSSWIGEKFRVMQNGDNIFYNALHEPITFKTQISINSSWEMYHSNINNIVVTASISNIEYIYFLGLSDSVATINLSVKDTNGQVIPSQINNYSLQLSKNYGLIRILNFYSFPFINQIGIDGLYSISDTLSLIGLNNPVAGWQNITTYDIYNWLPEWEFHICEEYSLPLGPFNHSGSLTQSIRKVINKTLSTESVNYTIDNCIRHVIFDGASEYESHDTSESVETISLNSPLNKLSYESFILDDTSFTFYNKTLSTILEQHWYFTILNNDTCIAHLHDDYYYTYSTWTIGLGSTYSNLGFYPKFRNYLVYYKKDTFEWGTPYVCSTLLNTESISNTKNEIIIYPNPNDGKFTIEYNNSNHSLVTISIENITGKPIFKTITREDKYYFNQQKLMSGVYIIKIKKDEEIIIMKLIKQ